MNSSSQSAGSAAEAPSLSLVDPGHVTWDFADYETAVQGNVSPADQTATSSGDVQATQALNQQQVQVDTAVGQGNAPTNVFTQAWQSGSANDRVVIIVALVGVALQLFGH